MSNSPRNIIYLSGSMVEAKDRIYYREERVN